MIRRPPRSTPLYSSAASDVYKRQLRLPTACLQTTMRCTSRRKSSQYATPLPLLPFVEAQMAARLSSLAPITKLLSKLLAKHYSLDPVLAWLVKRLTDYLAPVICHLCNASLQSHSLPASQKHVIVQPRLKKATLNSEGANSYRPTSFLSKIVERIVASRFANAPRVMLFPMKQSAHRQGHSTETAVC